jgi:hypothetical protein
MLKLIQKRLALTTVENEQENNRLSTRAVKTIPAVFQLGNDVVSYTGVTCDVSINSAYIHAEDPVETEKCEEKFQFIVYENHELQHPTTRRDEYGIALCIYNNKTTLSQFLPMKR